MNGELSFQLSNAPAGCEQLCSLAGIQSSLKALINALCRRQLYTV